jgi:hypothetical protein
LIDGLCDATQLKGSLVSWITKRFEYWDGCRIHLLNAMHTRYGQDGEELPTATQLHLWFARSDGPRTYAKTHINSKPRAAAVQAEWMAFFDNRCMLRYLSSLYKNYGMYEHTGDATYLELPMSESDHSMEMPLDGMIGIEEHEEEVSLEVALHVVMQAIKQEAATINVHADFSYWRTPAKDSAAATAGTHKHNFQFSQAGQLLKQHMPTMWDICTAASSKRSRGRDSDQPVDGPYRSNAAAMAILILLLAASQEMFPAMRLFFSLCMFVMCRGSRLIFEFISRTTRLCFDYRYMRKLLISTANAVEAGVRSYIKATHRVVATIIDNFQMIARVKYQRCDEKSTVVTHGVMKAAYLARGFEECKDMSTTPAIYIWDFTGNDIMKKGLDADCVVIDIEGHDAAILAAKTKAHAQAVMGGARFLGSNDQPSLTKDCKASKWAHDYTETHVIPLRMKSDSNLAEVVVNQQVFQDICDDNGMDAESEEWHKNMGILGADGVPYHQAQREIQRYALELGEAHWMRPDLGLFHGQWHVLEALSRYMYNIGYASLAELCGRTKVVKDCTKGGFECNDAFMFIVYAALLRAAVEEWEDVYESEGHEASALSFDEKYALFQDYMEKVCDHHPFTQVWYGEWASGYAMAYFMLRDAVHTGDAVNIEVVWRKVR